MATGASDGESQKSASGSVDLIVDLVVTIVIEETAQSEETKPRKPPARHFGLSQVSRQLILNELVERQILVESADHVITVRVSVRAQRVFAIGQDQILCIGIAGHIEPVASPALAIARRR